MKRSTRNSARFTVPEGLLAAATASTTTTAGNFSTRFSMPSFTKRVEKLTAEQRSAIQRMGFGNLLEIPNQTMSKSLLAELMNRWNHRKRVFELQSGEISITLMDVALILGLRVVGENVVLNEDEPLLELEQEFGASLGKRKIAVSTLESKLESLDGMTNEDFVRAFLLYMFGTFLFPSTNGKVDSRYLCCMKNLDCVGQFAWGAAVLEDLLGWLSKRKEMNVQYVGGCLIFLQIWSYEHIDIARPSLLSPLVLPRACRWENGKSHLRQEVTAKFKELQDHQIIWKLEPSSEELKIDVVKELLKKQNEGKELPGSENAPNNDSILNEDGLRSKSRILDPIVVKVKAESQTDTANETHRMHDHNTEQPQSPRVAAEIQIDNTAQYPSTSNSASETRNEEVGLRSGSQVLDHPMVVKMKVESEMDSANEAHRIHEHNVKVESEMDSANEAHRIHEHKLSPHKEAEIQIDSTSQYPSTSNSALETHNHDDDLRTKNKMLEVENTELRKELEKHKCEIILLKKQLVSTSLMLEEQIVELKQENDSLRRKNECSDDLVDRLERILLDEGY